MAAISFKVTIPPGSLLEQELKNMSGRQRTHHFYFLGELGARILPTLGYLHSIKSRGANQDYNANGLIEKEDKVITTEEIVESDNRGNVMFDVNDLMAIS